MGLGWLSGPAGKRRGPLPRSALRGLCLKPCLATLWHARDSGPGSRSPDPHSRPCRRSWLLLFALHSFWLPQILYCVRTEARQPLKPYYVIGAALALRVAM